MGLKYSLGIVTQISTSSYSSQHVLQVKTVELISLFFMVDFSIKLMNVHIKKVFIPLIYSFVNFFIHPRECYTKRDE